MIPQGLIVIGLGSDLCNIERIQASIDRFGDRFLNRIFTAQEQAKANRRELTRTGTYAKRFAAKEACSKALGTGIRMGVNWREMGVVNLPTGQPTMRLEGSAAARLAALTPKGLTPRIDVTITDDYPLAQAFVVISAWPADWPGTTA